MICFAWDGLPQYGAREIGAFCRMNPGEEVIVISSRPDIPLNLEHIEACVGCRVIWLDDVAVFPILERLGNVPDVVIQTGWYIPAFNAVGVACKAGGGIVIAMNDTNYDGTPVAWLRALRFRFWGYRHRVRPIFNGYMVPGKSGRHLHRIFGVPDKKIFEGLYGAAPELFYDGGALEKRPKRFLHVGRLDDRKNILMVCSAFLKIASRHPDWELHICGAGPLRDRIPAHPSIRVDEFVQPEELSRHYRDARCLVLASHQEHWGLVVHEAVLSGCFLLLSEKVGCVPEFACKDNAFLFSPNSEQELVQQMEKVTVLTEMALGRAREISLRLSKIFSPDVFARNLTDFIQGQKNEHLV